MGAADKKLWLPAAGQEVIVVVAPLCMHRQAESDRTMHPVVIAADLEADVCPKGETCEEYRQVKLVFQPGKGCANILLLTVAVVMHTFAEAGASEVEAENGKVEGLEGLHGVVNNLIVHGAAAQGMGVAYEHRVLRIRSAGVEERFKPACGASQVVNSSEDSGAAAIRRHLFTILIVNEPE